MTQKQKKTWFTAARMKLLYFLSYNRLFPKSVFENITVFLKPINLFYQLFNKTRLCSVIKLYLKYKLTRTLNLSVLPAVFCSKI